MSSYEREQSELITGRFSSKRFDHRHMCEALVSIECRVSGLTLCLKDKMVVLEKMYCTVRALTVE